MNLFEFFLAAGIGGVVVTLGYIFIILATHKD